MSELVEKTLVKIPVGGSLLAAMGIIAKEITGNSQSTNVLAGTIVGLAIGAQYPNLASEYLFDKDETVISNIVAASIELAKAWKLREVITN